MGRTFNTGISKRIEKKVKTVETPIPQGIKETRSCEHGYLVRKIIYHEILLKAMKYQTRRLRSPFVTAGKEEMLDFNRGFQAATSEA